MSRSRSPSRSACSLALSARAYLAREAALAHAPEAAKIIAEIQRRRLTQSQAAAVLGIDQPKVSAMLGGQFRGYSVERLMRFLAALGHDVEIVVKPRKRGVAGLRVA